MFETKHEAAACLTDMKEQEPFRPFSVVTLEGQRHRVNGRYRFAFNDKYVLLYDEDVNELKRVRFEKITQIEQY
ncbi:MAG TPA: hypothetical protein VF595_01215 [Tepidisphaeraceae bacterium]|jgi:hypothetical protein